MSESVRVGMIGTSWWADERLLPNLKGHPRADVAAICGRNRERAEAMAQKYDIPCAFSDYREMIEQADLDAVVIATPDDLHYPMTMAALDAGLHVVCEKPLASNVQQARAMYEKAEAVGVKHMVFFTCRWLPQYRYLAQLVHDGYIGRCFDCHMDYLSDYSRSHAYQWRVDRKRANGVLGDLGAHMIDLARWYVGDIVKVSAHLATFIERPGADGGAIDPANDSAMLMLQFANGAQGMLTLSLVAHRSEGMLQQQIKLHGDGGTLEADLLPVERTEIRGAREGEQQAQMLSIPDELWSDGDRSNPYAVFEKQSAGCRMFVDAILEDHPLTPSFYEGLKVQEVIDAAIASDRSGGWVSVP